MKTVLENNTRQQTHRRTITLSLCAGMLSLLSVTTPACSQDKSTTPVQPVMEFVDPSEISLGGLLGDALSASRTGRLTKLPSWNNGELITMFAADTKNNHDKTDWYGEHAGKWLYATANAAAHGKNPALKKLLLETADYLVANQEADGYLGSYSPRVRLTNASARHVRSWDAWALSYMALGLLEVNRYFPQPQYLNAAKKIGVLFFETFGPGKRDITEYGTRHGISATIILDPVVELYKLTGDSRYLSLAQTIVERMEAREGAQLVSFALNGGDMELVGDGKAYQLLWNLTAIAKLYTITGNADYLNAVRNAWQNITTHHLTIAGGPWGGVGKHLECFNKKNFWNPYGFIETCSTMSWIQLNKVLLAITGDAKYAEEIERAAYNALLGARYPNGVDWAYHSFSNGRRHIAHFNDCCPSSGALALEELPGLVYTIRNNGVACNLFTPNDATIALEASNKVHLVQETGYPFDGPIRLTVSPSKAAKFSLFVRIPSWAVDAKVTVNGKPVAMAQQHGYVPINRLWRKNDVVGISLPMTLMLHQKTERAEAPQGGPDLFQVQWFALTRGPLVFSADGLIGGTNREAVVKLTSEDPTRSFAKIENPDGLSGPAYKLKTDKESEILFLPYYQAGGQATGTWRLTWLQRSIN